MLCVGLTMRVEKLPNIGERRDCIDQRWYDFLSMCNLSSTMIANSELFTSERYLSELSGIIFTGGNSLSSLGGDAPERDEIENKLIDYAIEKRLPLMGVCRGMQILQNYFGVPLEKIQNHLKKRHDLVFKEQNINVNSFHDYGASTTVHCLEALAVNSDGIIEAIKHKELPFMGIMWHPEREEPFSNFDIQLFREHFQS